MILYVLSLTMEGKCTNNGESLKDFFLKEKKKTAAFHFSVAQYFKSDIKYILVYYPLILTTNKYSLPLLGIALPQHLHNKNLAHGVFRHNVNV